MSIRVQKVEELLKQQVSILIRENLPEELGIVTVTDAEATSDLKQAKVYIVLVDKSKEEQVLKALTAKTADFHHFLGKTLKMRYTPRLTFKLDASKDKIDRVEALLQEIDHGNFVSRKF